MKINNFIVPLYIVFLSATQLSSQSNPRAFYIGHSLTDYIPEMLESLSDSSSNTFDNWSFQSIPGAPLRWQWDRKAANDYAPSPPSRYPFYHQTNGLPSGDFDVLVLTESVPRNFSPWGIYETYDYVDSFYNYATQFNPNIQIYIYEVWHCILSGTPTACSYDVNSNPWRQRLDDDLDMWESVVDTLNNRFNPTNPVCLIPGGQGLARLYDSMQAGALPGITQLEDLFEDDIHLNDTGRYFIACVHYASIHKSSPVGLPNQLFNAWGGPFDAPSPQLALKMQEIAWLTVVDYPANCLGLSNPSQLVVYDSICQGEKYAFNGDSLMNSGQYYDTLKDIYNNDSVIIELNLFVHQVTIPTISNNNLALSVSSNYYSYQWQLNGVDILLANDSIFNPSQTGLYTINVVDSNMCSSSNSINYNTTGLSKLQLGSLEIYPNPSNSLIYLNKQSSAKIPYSIYNIKGKVISKGIYTSKGIDISSYKEGIYFIEVDGQISKLIKN